MKWVRKMARMAGRQQRWATESSKKATKWNFESIRASGLSVTAAAGFYFSYCNWWNAMYGPNTDFALDQEYLQVLGTKVSWNGHSQGDCLEYVNELSSMLDLRGMILVVGNYACGKTTVIRQTLGHLPGLKEGDEGKGIICLSITLKHMESGIAEEVLKEKIFNKFEDARSNDRASRDLTDFLERANRLCLRKYGHRLVLYITLDNSTADLTLEQCQEIAGSLGSLGRIQDYDRGTCKIIVEISKTPISDTIERYYLDVSHVLRVNESHESDFLNFCSKLEPNPYHTIGKDAVIEFHNKIGGYYRIFETIFRNHPERDEFLKATRRYYSEIVHHLRHLSKDELALLKKIAESGVRGYILTTESEMKTSYNLFTRSTAKVLIRSAGGFRVRIHHIPHAYALLDGDVEKMKTLGFL
eukprot:TRINITY_DN10681_c0_g1_i1.p1 TRINITY_DN10681_c0_g1~~TRINITY_DN10681_c0_g1_i1.p1  ORF type:complete len:414 (+),score=49.84 TRINITY_DN10681_c0_g1_i1:52-1293(+)